MTEKGECSDGEAKETSPLSHTPLSRGTYPAVAGYLQRGNVGTKKGKLGNERISKLERDLGRAVGQGRGGGLI